MTILPVGPVAWLGRTICRRGVVLGLALTAAVISGQSFGFAQDHPGSQELLPENTRGWLSIPDAVALRDSLEKTQFGQMTEDPEVKPFVDDLIKQFRAYLNEQNIRFGMTVADIEDVASGEICLAGVLRPAAAGAVDVKPDHAVVLLVDVVDSREKAEALLTRVADELQAREATAEQLQIGEIEATKWAFKQPRGLREKQFAFHAIVGRWLLACDNEVVFRDTVSRIAHAADGVRTHLTDNEAFQAIQERCQFKEENYTPHIRWFVEPFGYLRLAEAIADAKSGKELRNDYAELLENEGFSAIKGVGGTASLATGKHEAVHRTLIYCPVTEEKPLERGAALLDFENIDGLPLNPPAWVPENSASYLTFAWNLPKALDSIGYVIDSFAGTPGSWQRTLDGIKNDPKGPQVDLRKVAASMENRITVASITQTPIDENSERIVVGIRILDKDDEAFVTDAVYRMVKNDASAVQHEGTRVLIVDTADASDLELPEIDADQWEDEFNDSFGVPVGGEVEPDEAELEQEPPKPLFEKKVFAVKNGILLIGNNLDEVKTVLSQMESGPGNRLLAAEDYQRIERALQELAGDLPPSFRHFGRLDQAIRTNYEMMRTGRMGQSKTLLAQILNRAYSDPDAPEDAVRKQQIDGSKMPEDFEGKVARYFGPTGLVVQSVDNGWLLTGCMLKNERAAAGDSISQTSTTAADQESDNLDR